MKKIQSVFLKIEDKAPLHWKWLLVLLIIIFIPHLYISYIWYLQTTMPDLYMKIIGSRLYSQGFNPYFYVWKPGDPFSLFNPNYFELNGLNGVTVTPFYLWLQIPLSKLFFCNAKMVWWIIMEALLFLSIFISLLNPKNFIRQTILLLILVSFFLFSRNWWLHIYNGQYYVMFAFVFSLSGYWAVHNKANKRVLWMFPVFSIIRPYFILALIPWLIKNPLNKLKILLIGVFISIIFILLAGNFSTWKNYQSAMNAYGNVSFIPLKNGVAEDPRNYKVPLEDCMIKVEHFPTTQSGCLFELQHYLRLLGFKVENPLLFPLLLIISIVIFIAIIPRKYMVENQEVIFLTSFLIYIMCELFTPAPRNPYNIVQYLGIMGVFISRGSFRYILLAVIGLALNHDFPFRFAYQREIGELLLLSALFLTIIHGRRKITA